MPDKVLVTNNSALSTKYGANKQTIDSAIQTLISADSGRGLQTVVIAVDDATAMSNVGGSAVASATDQPSNKAAVDAIYKSQNPDYIVLLGGPDVMPHIDLTNPAADGNNDPDTVVPSDLPYACDAAYSMNIGDFVGPTRVVSRITDITAGSDANYLAQVINDSCTTSPADPSNYSTYLGVTAAVWAQSTQLSLQAIFGNSNALQQVPPSTYQWTSAQLGALSHYFNCHGSSSDSHFYGQQGSNYPVAHDAAFVNGKISAGTVLAAECCYGAQLYDPASASGQMCMANTYVGQGAWAYLGSTTIAYGPSDSNANADLICQYFFQEMLKGESVGEALLHARQRYVQNTPNMGPTDLKTLAQFILLADASTHVVSVPTPVGDANAKFMPSVAGALAGLTGQWRKQRRMAAAELGAFLKASKAVAGQKQVLNIGDLPDAVKALVDRAGFANPSALSFAVQLPSLRPHTNSGAPDISAFHLIFDQGANRGPHGAARRVLEIQTSNGNVLGAKELYTR